VIVLCVNCDTPLYNCSAIGAAFSGDKVRPEDFVPLTNDIDPPAATDQMTCPSCGQLFIYPSPHGGVLLKLEGGSWWPHPPIKIGRG
jgi:hypothetical protein